MAELAIARLSPDRRWWWTDAGWTSAYSGDGSWRWDRSRWRSVWRAWMRWSLIVGLLAAGAGIVARAAGTYEHFLARQPVPKVWTNYQPPWVNPVYAAGLLLLIVGIGITGATLIAHLARTRCGARPAPLA